MDPAITVLLVGALITGLALWRFRRDSREGRYLYREWLPGRNFGRKKYYTSENAPGFWRLYRMTPISVIGLYVFVVVIVIVVRFGS